MLMVEGWCKLPQGGKLDQSSNGKYWAEGLLLEDSSKVF